MQAYLKGISNVRFTGKYSRLTITVPEVNKVFQNFSAPATKRANIDKLRTINTKYGAMCTRWGNIFELEKGVLVAFIATESGGKADAISFVGCCFGLMQVSPDAVFECANKFKAMTGQDLPVEVANELRKTPNLLGARTISNTTKTAIRRRLFDPNFNIMCGTMILRWLLERFSTLLTGAQLNKAIVGYNAGAYTRGINVTAARPIKTPIDTTSLVSTAGYMLEGQRRSIPSETRNYLVKMLGVDGFLSLIYKDNAIPL